MTADPSWGGECEIWGQRVDGSTGARIADRLRISSMGPDGDRFYGANGAAVAVAGANSRFLVVWGGDGDGGALVNDEWEIWGQLYTTHPPVYLPTVLRDS